MPVSFPESVLGFFRGDLGQPPGGFPKALQKKVLGKEKAISVRPGSILPAVDLDEWRTKLKVQLGHEVSGADLASSLMYPEVFAEYARQRKQYGDVSVLPTHVYFYGMQAGAEIVVRVEQGRQAIIRFLTSSDPDEDGIRRVFFEVNGQPLTILVKDRSLAAPERAVEKADPANPLHVAAPMPGLVVAVEVSSGQSVRKGDTLLVIEAMKMQTALTADRHGIIRRVLARPDHVVDAKDLLLEFEAE